MGNSLWQRFRAFVQDSFTQKFKYCFPGICMGFVSARSLLFSGLPAELVTLGSYILKYAGTVVMAFSSGLATSYAAYLIEKHKEHKKKDTTTRKRNKAA